MKKTTMFLQQQFLFSSTDFDIQAYSKATGFLKPFTFKLFVEIKLIVVKNCLPHSNKLKQLIFTKIVRLNGSIYVCKKHGT